MESYSDVEAKITEFAPVIRQNVERLLQHLNLDQAKFARRVGISSATMSRITAIKAQKPVSTNTLDRIANSLGINRDWLFTVDQPLPTIRKSPLLDGEGEGIKLKQFLKRHDITHKRLADALSVHQPTVTYYTQARQLTLDVKARLVLALSELLGREVREIEVFGKDYNLAIVSSTVAGRMVEVPRLPVASRRGLNIDRLERLQIGSDHSPSKKCWIDAQLVIGIPIINLYALEIASFDRMEPRLSAGDWVLMEEVSSDLRHTIHQGVVAVLTYYHDFYIRQVRVNDLAGSAKLTLNAYNDVGATITLKSSDIAAMFRLHRIIDAQL